VSKPAQDAAVNARNEVMANEPEPLKEALVAVDPKTGAVLAYYGGASGRNFDYAQSPRQPGSSVKPYVLATALEQGISVNARRDGSDKQMFPGRLPGHPVRNSGGASCPACTLQEAIVKSLNTTFYGLTYEVGPPKVRDVMLKATGLPDKWSGGNLKGQTVLADPKTGGVDAGLGIGQYAMRPIDQAVGFATFAAGGVHRNPYFVAKVTDSDGTQLLGPRPTTVSRSSPLTSPTTSRSRSRASPSTPSGHWRAAAPSPARPAPWARRTRTTPTRGWWATPRRSRRRSGWARTPTSPS
jgi:membrane peptidoglycan carboxypeptidase